MTHIEWLSTLTTARIVIFLVAGVLLTWWIVTRQKRKLDTDYSRGWHEADAAIRKGGIAELEKLERILKDKRRGGHTLSAFDLGRYLSTRSHRFELDKASAWWDRKDANPEDME